MNSRLEKVRKLKLDVSEKTPAPARRWVLWLLLTIVVAAGAFLALKDRHCAEFGFCNGGGINCLRLRSPRRRYFRSAGRNAGAEPIYRRWLRRADTAISHPRQPACARAD